MDSRTVPVSFEVLKSKLKVLHMSNDGIWGFQGFPFPTINTLEMERRNFRLPKVRMARDRRGLETEEDQEERVHEGGEALIPTLQPIHPPSNNAIDYRIESMIAAILHNQQSEKEARPHIMVCIQTIREKMNIPIDDAPTTFNRFTSPIPLHDEEEGPSEKE
ncbi:unnamed protein product [Linum trigynum]|uniref:Uncharacterized protein n=1 Tax=Linum trigynum TaxID=586398 RepID=A0AAV2FNU8_9ROSI